MEIFAITPTKTKGRTSSGGSRGSMREPLNGFCQDDTNQKINILIAQVNIMNEWIKQQFGVNLINQESPLIKAMNFDSDEIKQLTKSLSLPTNSQSSCATKPENIASGIQNKKTGVNIDQHEVVLLDDEDHSNHFEPSLEQIDQKPVIIEGRSLVVDPGPTTFSSSSFNRFQNWASQTRRAIAPSYNCCYCSEQFANSGNLFEHLKTHYQFRCSRCPKTFTSQERLNNHLKLAHKIKIDSGNEVFSCKYCPKRFSKEGSLAKHLKIHIRERSEQFICRTCGRVFADNVSLVNHTKLHKRRRGLFCEYCQKKFFYKHSLTIHLKAHSCEKSNSTQEASIPTNIPTSTPSTSRTCRKELLIPLNQLLEDRDMEVYCQTNETDPLSLTNQTNETDPLSLTNQANETDPLSLTNQSVEQPMDGDTIEEEDVVVLGEPAPLESLSQSAHTPTRNKSEIIIKSGLQRMNDLLNEQSESEPSDSIPILSDLEPEFSLSTTQGLTCPFCKSNFNKQSGYESHMNSNVCGQNPRCHICHQQFTNKYTLKTHLQKSHAEFT